MKRLLALAAVVFYVVTWKSTEQFYKPCPQTPTHNAYTQRDEYSDFFEAIACFDTVTSTHSWNFKSIEDAETFIGSAPKNDWRSDFSDWNIKRVEETEITNKGAK